MARFTAYTPELAAPVARFNGRMGAGTFSVRFPTGPDLFDDPSGASGVSLDRFIALDPEGEMRAGYLLKHQLFKLGGALEEVGNLQAPMSEGVLNHAYAAYGSSIVLDAVRRAPRVYTLGMGGADQPYPRLLAALKWRLVPVPFFFKVLAPFRFCRRIRFLRRRWALRLGMDLLAFSGLGPLGFRLLNLASRTPAAEPGFSVEPVARFAPWADPLWSRASGGYALAAVRDAKVLDFLYRDDRFLRFRVSREGRAVGWAVCLATRFEDHRQFGDLKVGSLVDCLAEPGAEARVVAAAEQGLARAGVDLIVSNQSHRAWQRALARAGYLKGPSNFLLACSPGLWRAMGDLGIGPDQVHMNRGDGDGPIHL